MITTILDGSINKTLFEMENYFGLYIPKILNNVDDNILNPQSSWKKLSDLVYEISEGEDQNIAMQIDDEAFSSYGVNAVPAIILAEVFSD